MADKKITELPAATALDTDDLIPVVEDGTTVKATVAQLRTGLDVPTNAEAVLDTLVDAKGDLLTATAADTPARLAVGTNGHVLTADSAEATGIKWAAGAGGSVASDTIWNAKGDLAAATAADTATVVTVGADRTLLRSDSNASTGVRWGTDLIRTRSTGWHYNAHLATPASSAWPILSRAYYVPFFLPGRALITAVGVNVTAAGTASNVVRLGIYSDSGSFAPGTILDQGTVAGDSIAFATWTPSSAVAVTDVFWLAACPQGTSTPGSTWLSLFAAHGLAFAGAQETGASWAGTYVSGMARYSAEAGAFSSSPSLTFEVQSRNPYLAVRLQ